MKVFVENYRGKSIPSIGGIVFIPVLLTSTLLLLMLFPMHKGVYEKYLLVVLCMGFAGVVDDLAGDRKIKGFMKHIKSTFEGNLTTGFLKALIGFGASLLVSLDMSQSLPVLILNTLVVSLSANTINIFDLRPGRAAKIFLSASILLLALSKGRYFETLPIAILSAATLLYIRYDLREMCMLGDTGANILGISIGYYCAFLLGDQKKLLILILLLAVNLISEKISLTVLIEGNTFLKSLDNMGRRRNRNN